MAQVWKVTMEQYKSGQPGEYTYMVTQVANAVTPHVNEMLTEAKVSELIELGCEVVVKGHK